MVGSLGPSFIRTYKCLGPILCLTLGIINTVFMPQRRKWQRVENIVQKKHINSPYCGCWIKLKKEYSRCLSFPEIKVQFAFSFFLGNNIFCLHFILWSGKP